MLPSVCPQRGGVIQPTQPGGGQSSPGGGQPGRSVSRGVSPAGGGSVQSGWVGGWVGQSAGGGSGQLAGGVNWGGQPR